MRRLVTILIVVFITAMMWAQAPQKMSYQAVIRNNSGVLVTNTQIGMEINIRQGSPTGTIVYTETQTPTTNANGLVSVEIGGGAGFGTINWGANTYYIETKTAIVAPLTTYTITGVSQLLSVPYALNAKTAESITGTMNETDPVYTGSQAANIKVVDITKLSNLSGINTGDQDLSGLATKTALNDSIALVRMSIPDVSGKVDKETGKGLSANNYTTDEQTKLAGIAAGAQVNVQADWNQTLITADDYIKNKPTILNSQWTTSDSNIYYNTGKVGIGTTNPSANLEVNGTVKITDGTQGVHKVLTSDISGGASWQTLPVESQALSISHDTVSLSNGGYVKLPATSWSLKGNSGTVNGTDFIGTKDNVPLSFRVNNIAAGRIEGYYGQTFLGSYAGAKNYSNASGNTGIGFYSMYNNTSGEWNTSVGRNSLQLNTVGTHNTAIGGVSLSNNVNGVYNTGIGYGALLNNISGSRNSAVGLHTLKNCNGDYNTALGFESGYNMVSGSNNVFLGYQAGYNETGSSKLYIANSSNNPPLIYGDFSTVRVGIGTITPAYNLDINGDANISGRYRVNGTPLATVATTGSYADLTNTPTFDGSETKITAGTNVTVTGSGTTASPYVVNAAGNPTLTIGQSYQGGIIFWLDVTGQHGLIAATVDQSTGIQWYNGTNRYTGTTGDGLYAGAMNTAMIVATQMADNQTGNFAAKVCADYSVTVDGVTYGDWYLPSKYELNLLYLQQAVIGGFASGGTNIYYWSSSEYDLSTAWRHAFGYGEQFNGSKNGTGYVRAIRAF